MWSSFSWWHRVPGARVEDVLEVADSQHTAGFLVGDDDPRCGGDDLDQLGEGEAVDPEVVLQPQRPVRARVCGHAADQ
jgi:hypothetical protein